MGQFEQNRSKRNPNTSPEHFLKEVSIFMGGDSSSDRSVDRNPNTSPDHFLKEVSIFIGGDSSSDRSVDRLANKYHTTPSPINLPGAIWYSSKAIKSAVLL
ncbi:hypothetical protein CEXT_250221 [Caerostris extrusa]|uniref:Uncharacterized protein n=1 Tax=Caerostris extrusa TaxID=172846 RepID=A0AAV4TCA0_CAEEX|nr:hypothetical protein CEXT_250221 [Caerostris extrusa]